MPDLSTRDKHEAAIVAVLLSRFETFRQNGRNGRNASWSVLGTDVESSIQPLIVTVYLDAAEGLARSRGADFDRDRYADEARIYAAGRAALVARGVVDGTVDALAGGESTDGVLGIDKAEQIAITEVTAGISAGEAIAIVLILAISNERLVPIWHTEQDGLVCPICRPLHGTGQETFGQVSPTGPPAHPRCRCWLDYEVAS